jgi:hypothetical protein
MSAPSLTIAIPALNEEQAIGGTIERCLQARAELQAAGVGEVRVVVVSDGSTDRTAAIARGYPDVTLVEFETNRGYGAAIKAAWERAPSDLLAFLDADGTCDPKSFVPMIRKIADENCDLVLGGRMGEGSRMPALRRLGNVLFALLLGHLARRSVRDTASGMRVLKRQALPRLLPLPDGLHFTPAMSARALMDDEVVIAEIEMPYAERVGRSKLRVIRDGFRFLGVILGAAAFVRVSRLTLPLVALLGMAAAALVAAPAAFYLGHGRLEEWMFYRCALAGTLGTVAVTLLCGTIVTEHVSALTLLRYDSFSPRARGLWRYENVGALLAAALVLGFVAVALNADGAVELFATGHVTLHWSRVMLGAFFGINLAQLATTVAMLRILRALHERQPFLRRSGD